MLPIVCFTCGKLLGEIQVPYEEDILQIENNTSLSNEEKSDEKAKLLDKYHIKTYCCRSRVLTYIKLINIIT